MHICIQSTATVNLYIYFDQSLIIIWVELNRFVMMKEINLLRMQKQG